MPIKEVLRAIVFLHRISDDQDFTETIDCIPDARMKYLEDGLRQLRDEGIVDMVQIGRMRYQATVFTDYEDQCDDFFARVAPEGWLHSSTDRATPPEGEDSGSIPDEASNFTGFNDIELKETASAPIVSVLPWNGAISIGNGNDVVHSKEPQDTEERVHPED